jgi:hypothetical protein
MFQLDIEVRRWCKRAIPAYWLRSSHLAEMEDHLLCLVEQLTKNGTTTEQAFQVAIERLGEAKLVRGEFRKNGRYALNHCLRYSAAFTVMSCFVLIATASVIGVDLLAWTHHLLVAIYASPSSFLNYFSKT